MSNYEISTRIFVTLIYLKFVRTLFSEKYRYDGFLSKIGKFSKSEISRQNCMLPDVACRFVYIYVDIYRSTKYPSISKINYL